MRIYVQWSKATAEDWQPVDVQRGSDVRRLPRRPVPTTPAIDNEPGWVCAVNCQGVVFEGYDHIAVETIGASLRITGWNDDPADWPVGTRYAVAWDFRPLEADASGQLNTDQTRTVWAEPTPAAHFLDLPVRPWSEFAPPPGDLTLHGVWLPDELYLGHAKARTQHGWREWA